MLHKHADGMLDSAGPNQTKQHEPGLYWMFWQYLWQYFLWYILISSSGKVLTQKWQTCLTPIQIS